MEEKIKIAYPDSEKVYMKGELYPDMRVGMRRVKLTPTVVVENGEKVSLMGQDSNGYNYTLESKDPAWALSSLSSWKYSY